MNNTLRAISFGSAIAAVLTVTLTAMTAMAAPQVVRLEAVQVTAHRDAFDADGNLKAVRLDPVVVVAHRSNIG